MFETRSVEETLELGRKVGARLEPGDVLCLVGELGSGKTHFTRGIAEGLEVADPLVVTSPTFILMNQYEGRCPIRHYDLYRIEGSELVSLGFQDWRSTGISILEWGEKAPPSLIIESLRVEIEITGENSRRFEFKASGERPSRILQALIGEP
jgi:tRNA threonylcarbamoyladenosine biosynthesis protein TsaE